MPVKEATLRSFGDMPSTAFADAAGHQTGDGPKTLIYDFDVKPGELLVWNVQWWHNTSFWGEGNERTFAMTGHLQPQDIRRWARRTGRFTADGNMPRNYFWEVFWTQQHCSNMTVRAVDVGIYDTCWNSWFGRDGTRPPVVDGLRQAAKTLVNGDGDR